MPRQLVTLLTQKEGVALARKHCKAIDLNLSDLENLLEVIIEQDHKLRRRGLRTAFDEILDPGSPDIEDQPEEY